MPPAAEMGNKDEQAQASQCSPHSLWRSSGPHRHDALQVPEGSCAQPRGSPSSVGTVTMHPINILFLCNLHAQGTKLSHKKVLLLMKNPRGEGQLLSPTWPVLSPQPWPVATSTAAAVCSRRLPPLLARAPSPAQRRAWALGTASRLLEELLRLLERHFCTASPEEVCD